MNKTYIPALLAIGLMAVLHDIGNTYYLYVRLDWYDIMMHLLGGVGIALSVYWCYVTIFRKTPSFLNLVILTFIAGFLWEGMEAYYDIAGGPIGSAQYYFDSIKDLVNDTIGAIAAGYFLHKK